MYLGEKRSVRIRNQSTTIRLERPFWQALEGIASNQRISLSALINRVKDGYGVGGEEIRREPNLASRLRVYCLSYNVTGPEKHHNNL